MLGNASYITGENVYKLNNEAMRIYDLREGTLSQQDIETLKQILMICNVLYNRTDLTLLPIEDGFYDLLLEEYKRYDSNFQVGSAIVDFQNFIETNEISNSRIIFFYDEEYYNNFWKRNDSYQTWEKIDSKNSLKQKLNIQTNLKEIGFKETINDEDFKYETELWVYGDIEDIK